MNSLAAMADAASAGLCPQQPTAQPAAADECPLVFGCQGETLFGMLHRAADGQVVPAAIGIVVVVGGPQYRVGSHRQFISLARTLAAAGYPVLRFDVRGMGDSSGNLHDFRSINPDIEAAIDALQRHEPGVRQLVLWGLCDGASAALLYLHDRADPRISGLCLVNPWVRSEASLARTQLKHYYTKRLLQRDFWHKLMGGGVGLAALRDLAVNARRARAAASSAVGLELPFQTRMARAWRDFEGSILLLLSSDDYTAREFDEYTSRDPSWDDALERHPACRQDLIGADHTLSDAVSRIEADGHLLSWLAKLPSSTAVSIKELPP